MNNKSVYLIYETLNCTPNGDPDTGEQRYNEINQKAEVTDLRINRFARDRMHEIGIPIYYIYDKERIVVGDKKISGSAARFNHHCRTNNITIDKNTKISKILCDEFLDVRLCGATLTSKDNNTHVTGCLHWNAVTESENTVLYGENLVNRGITSVFPSNDSKGQGSMGRDTFLRYGLFCVKGYFNATVAAMNEATEEDLNKFISIMWDGMKNNTSRSKYGHNPIAVIVVNHPTERSKNGYIGRTFNKNFTPFVIDSDKNKSDFYSSNDYDFNFTPLREAISGENVESVTVYCEDEEFSNKHFVNLGDNVSIIKPFDELMNIITEIE